MVKLSFTSTGSYRDNYSYHSYLDTNSLYFFLFVLIIFTLSRQQQFFEPPMHFLKLPPLCKRSTYPRVSASKVPSPLRWLHDYIGVLKRQFIARKRREGIVVIHAARFLEATMSGKSTTVDYSLLRAKNNR